ncbi:MAG TPA: bifunctional hydroxymethylpyrimidine kinase/phosphomethylpyrimidine kinase, partial [Caulobacteraceae bacterium]
MPTALILSSYVASSRVGGAMQVLALTQFRFEPILVPTVLYGRHPGWGVPGGGPAPIEMFESMLDGVEANGAFEQVDLVITGYFASAAQVRAAARAIDAVRAVPRGEGARRPLVVVDPTMGDSGKGLYVPADVPPALAAELIRRADFVTPNAWELERLTGLSARSPDSAVDAARLLGRPTMVSSVERGAEIGVVYADKAEAWFAAHARAAAAPQGAGDLLTALFAAALS